MEAMALCRSETRKLRIAAAMSKELIVAKSEIKA